MSHDEQCLAVVKGVLGGNMFDWGAKEVAALMESTQFGFSQALDKLQGTFAALFHVSARTNFPCHISAFVYSVSLSVNCTLRKVCGIKFRL